MPDYILNIDADVVDKVLDTQYHTPVHDCADSAYTTGSRQAITANTEYRFENDAVTLDLKSLPSHITKLWDSVNNKAVFTEELNTPVYVARVQLNFDPTSANAGDIEIKAYIDETSPKLIQTVLARYKAEDTRVNAIFTFYVGSETGYDMKTNGLYFTYTTTQNGEVYDRGILLYRT